MSFTFIDLFAGIGGFHIAMHELGGECVFASEIDKYARMTYEHNLYKMSPKLFDNGMFNNDIRNISPEEIPDHDILCAGFPCQPFSQAGKKKGFNDGDKSERGNLFFVIADILEVKRPKAFFLENVRHLIKHDNGNTFKTIQSIITELGYSFYYKVVKASDYGLPQHRPRVFMIGFKDEGFMKGFNYPQPTPLLFTMDEVMGGVCNKKIGFTLRVGGRGSGVRDRRNWDCYLVDGKEVKLSSEQGKKMQGFLDTYEFPVSETQAMKQLGNSVAILAVKAIASRVIKYLTILENNNKEQGMAKKVKVPKGKNKGEWTEIYVLVKSLHEKKIHLANVDLTPKATFFDISKVSTRNTSMNYHILDNNQIKIIDTETKIEKIVNVSTIITKKELADLLTNIQNGKGSSFFIPSFNKVKSALLMNKVKGGNSNQKSDILYDISYTPESLFIEDEGFGIKSHLGKKPTLLNSSGSTNFIYEIRGGQMNDQLMNQINAIVNNRGKASVKDRVAKIVSLGCEFVFFKIEKTVLNRNLKMVDTIMPDIVSLMLLAFHKDRISKVSKIVDHLWTMNTVKSQLGIDDKVMLKAKVSSLLVAILLGMFAGSEWDGNYLANGTIIVKLDGEFVTFHIVDLETLKEYLYKNIKIDTPSVSKFKYASVYKEKGKYYFKLNLQLRF